MSMSGDSADGISSPFNLQLSMFCMHFFVTKQLPIAMNVQISQFRLVSKWRLPKPDPEEGSTPLVIIIKTKIK